MNDWAEKICSLTTNNYLYFDYLIDNVWRRFLKLYYLFAVGASTKENDATEASDEQGSFDDFYKVLIAAIVIVLVLLLCLTICYIVRRKQKVVCQGPVRWRSLPDESATYEILNTGELRITSDICFTRPSMIVKKYMDLKEK